MDLAEFQRWLMKGIDPLSDPAEQQIAHNMLVISPGLSASERLHVYRNNITSTRVRALQAIYPVCEMTLGSDCFAGVARAYCWRVKDAYADLNVYGETFAAFLGGQSQSPEFAGLPYLEELAEVEWRWHAAYYAADDSIFDHEAFATAATRSDQLRFVLANGLTLLQTAYPVREVWRRHRAQENTGSIPALEAREYLCIHRQNHEPLVTPVSISMYSLLERIQQGSNLVQLGEQLGDELPGLLPMALQAGWIAGFTSDP